MKGKIGRFLVILLQILKYSLFLYAQFIILRFFMAVLHNYGCGGALVFGFFGLPILENVSWYILAIPLDFISCYIYRLTGNYEED